MGGATGANAENAEKEEKGFAWIGAKGGVTGGVIDIASQFSKSMGSTSPSSSCPITTSEGLLGATKYSPKGVGADPCNQKNNHINKETGC